VAPDSHRIDELFRQRMGPLKASPPPMAWDRLSDALDHEPLSSYSGIPAKGLSSVGASALGWLRQSWTGIAVVGLLFSGLLLTPERIGYTAVHQRVVASQHIDYLNPDQQGFAASAPAGDPVNTALAQAGVASAQTAELPAPTARVSDNPAAQENLVPIAGGGAGAAERGSLAAAAGLTLYPEAAATPTIAEESLAAASCKPLPAQDAAETAALAFPPAIAAATTALDAPSAAANRTKSPSPWTNVYGGLHGSLQWTGLLSQNNGKPDENLNPLLNIGYAFGLHAGYRFNPRVSLETGLVLNSMQGSRYESSVETRNEELPVTKALMLHYTQVPLTVRISPGSIKQGRNPQGQMPEGWTYVGGLQYGMLRTSKLRIEDKPVNPERKLQEHDVAVLLGMDYDLPLNDQLFVTLGFRGSLGLNQANVTTVEGINSDKRNAVLGFRAAFNGFLLPQ